MVNCHCKDPMVGLTDKLVAVCAVCGKEYVQGEKANPVLLRALFDIYTFRIDNAIRVLNRITMSRDEDAKADAKYALSYLEGENDEWRKGNPRTAK